MTADTGLVGFADMHNHQFANLAFGGHVLYGQPAGTLSELSTCRRDHGPHGLFDLAGNVSTMLFDHAGPKALLGHSSRGWPQFSAWPRWDDYTHQGVHRSWLRRAVDGGLRLMVMLAVHNVALGRLNRPLQRAHSTWDVVAAQLDAARSMEAAVDRDHGGWGRGWYRVVADPDEAEQVIADGRLAVVLGAEVDDLFSLTGRTTVHDADLEAIVERCVTLGIHHLIPIHFADNGLGGAAVQVLTWARDQRPLSPANPLGSLPLYRVDTIPGSGRGYTYRGGRINALGLTDIGRRLLDRLMRAGIVVDVEHMGTLARADTLQLAEELGVPVVASHASFRAIDRAGGISERELTPQEHRRIVALGGMVAPITRQGAVDLPRLGARGRTESAHGLLAALRHAVARSGGRPVALGTDVNGFAGGTRPRFGVGDDNVETPLRYPFPNELAGEPPLERLVSGDRTFDINVDGLAHVGLLPDLLAELRVLGATDVDLAPVMRSAQGYLDVWRRCRSWRPGGPPGPFSA